MKNALNVGKILHYGIIIDIKQIKENIRPVCVCLVEINFKD